MSTSQKNGGSTQDKGRRNKKNKHTNQQNQVQQNNLNSQS